MAPTIGLAVEGTLSRRSSPAGGDSKNRQAILVIKVIESSFDAAEAAGYYYPLAPVEPVGLSPTFREWA